MGAKAADAKGAHGVSLVEPGQDGVDAQTQMLAKLLRLQGQDGEKWRRVDTMRALMGAIVRSTKEAKRALMNALQTQALKVQTVVFLIHLMQDDHIWFAGRVVDIVDEKQILALHNWAMVLPLEKKEKFQFERWIKVVDKLSYPILPFDWDEPEIVQYNQSLVVWASAMDADTPSGAGMPHPPKLLTREEAAEVKIAPAKPMKVAGGSVLPVQDVNGVLMADASVIEEAFRNMNAQRIVAEERIMALEAQVAALQAQKQAQPQQYQQYQPRNRSRSMGRGNGTRACFNCGSPSHFLKDCPTKPKDTIRPPQ